MALDLSAFDKLLADHPGMQATWRTRRAPSGWEAQCSAGYPGYISPIWKGAGETEQEALDKAVENAASYWTGWRERGGH